MFKQFLTLMLTAVCLAAALLIVLSFASDPPAPRVGNFISVLEEAEQTPRPQPR